jgi:hypothetical protein
MNQNEFEKKFFEDLESDCEKLLVGWKIEQGDAIYDPIECSAKWREAQVSIRFKLDFSGSKGQIKNVSCGIEMAKDGEYLFLNSDYAEKKIMMLLERIPFWLEARASNDILKLLDLEVSRRGHERHLTIFTRLKKLTLEGMEWKRNNSNRREGIGCMANYKGVLIEIFWHGQESGKDMARFSHNGIEWAIDAGDDFSYCSHNIDRIFCCRKCRDLLWDLANAIDKNYFVPRKKMEEEAYEEKVAAERKAEEIRLAERIRKIGISLFGE